MHSNIQNLRNVNLSDLCDAVRPRLEESENMATWRNTNR